MASLTLNPSVSQPSAGTEPAVPRPLADRVSALVDRIVTARARRAQTQVDGYLASLNDETLIDLGLDPAAVRHPGADPLLRFHL